jgi:hypothetical protein
MPTTIEELLELLKDKDDRVSRNLRCSLQDWLRQNAISAKHLR